MDQVRPMSSSNKRQSTSRTDLLQRWGPIAGAGVLALIALSKRSKTGVALAVGSGLVAQRLVDSGRAKKFHAEASFALNSSPEEAFRLWRNFENLPLFMRHLQSVTVTSDRRSEWKAAGPLGREVQWTAEIVDERTNEWIIWRSLPGSDFFHSGSVEFRTAPGQRGTIVTAVMDYIPPGGALGRAVATLAGKDPEFTLREDLRRFKALVEAKEIPTIEGQPHGPRSTLVKAIHATYPEKRKPTEPVAAGLVGVQQRRA
jgi:uncharacterized membrane protein